MNAWFLLALSIISELVGTMSLKASAGLTRILPSVLVFTGYSTAFWFLSQTIQRLPLSISYAVASGVSVAAAALISVLFFRESLNWFQVTSIGLIIVGVVGVNFSSQPH